MTHVSFAVQAHPNRAAAAAELADRIEGEVVWDPDPTGPPSPWRTFRHLLESTPVVATHRLQIQDDATVCPGFADAVRAAVAAQPDRLLVLYVGQSPRAHSQAVMHACAQDRPWAPLRAAGWLPVVCTVWPADLIDGLLAYYDKKQRPRGWVADDEITGRYVNESRIVPLATVPSLAEHLDNDDSLIGRRGGNGIRRAACWIGDCAECAAGIDWTIPP